MTTTALDIVKTPPSELRYERKLVALEDPDVIDARIRLLPAFFRVHHPTRWVHSLYFDTLSHIHLQAAVANAQVYDGPGAVNAGFLDEAVDADQVVATAIERAGALAELHPGAYAGTIAVLRSAVIERMRAPDNGSIIVG